MIYTCRYAGELASRFEKSTFRINLPARIIIIWHVLHTWLDTGPFAHVTSTCKCARVACWRVTVMGGDGFKPAYVVPEISCKHGERNEQDVARLANVGKYDFLGTRRCNCKSVCTPSKAPLYHRAIYFSSERGHCSLAPRNGYRASLMDRYFPSIIFDRIYSSIFHRTKIYSYVPCITSSKQARSGPISIFSSESCHCWNASRVANCRSSKGVDR